MLNLSIMLKIKNNKTEHKIIIDNELDYLAEVLVEVFLEQKGYKAIEWLNNEKRWIPPTNPEE